MQDMNDRLRDRLTGALIGLANAADSHAAVADSETVRLICEALTAQEAESISALIGKVHAEKARIAPDCAACKTPCGRNIDHDMRLLRYDGENVRRLKEEMLRAMRSAAKKGTIAEDGEDAALLLQGLRAIGDTWDEASLLSLAQKIARL